MEMDGLHIKKIHVFLNLNYYEYVLQENSEMFATQRLIRNNEDDHNGLGNEGLYFPRSDL